MPVIYEKHPAVAEGLPRRTVSFEILNKKPSYRWGTVFQNTVEDGLNTPPPEKIAPSVYLLRHHDVVWKVEETNQQWYWRHCCSCNWIGRRQLDADQDVLVCSRYVYRLELTVITLWALYRRLTTRSCISRRACAGRHHWLTKVTETIHTALHAQNKYWLYVKVKSLGSNGAERK